MVKIRLLHSQPFINSHFHFLIIMESVISQLFLQQPMQWGWMVQKFRVK
jgi:hypothetical protein